MKSNDSPSLGLQCLLCAAFLVASAFGLAAADTDSDLKKSFTVKPGGDLVVDVDSGPIEINTGTGSEVVIDVRRTVTGADASQAQAIFDAHEVKFDQDGDQIRLEARFKQDQNRLLRRGRAHFQVQYKISVPKQFNLNLRTGAGSITVADLEGTVKAKTSGGNLKFATIKGPLEANTAAGNISAGSITGTAVVKTSGGNINLGQVDAEATAETAAGSISVKNVRGKLILKSSGGNLDLGEVAAPAEISTAAGSIRVKIAGASLTAKTSGGNITIEDARETINAQTAAGSISVSFSAQPTGDCKLATAGGNIEVSLAEKLAFDVNAHTAGGRVSTELPVTTVAIGERKGNTLQGKLNGGGKELALKTSAGNISLRK